MSRDDNSVMNRRKAIKKMGMGSIALAGMPTVVSAEEYTSSDSAIQSLLDDPRIRAIEDAVGGFDVINTAERQIEKGSLTMIAVWIDTDVGKLLYVDPEGAETEVQLRFADLTEEPQLRQRLPQEYQSVPAGCEIVLKADPSVSMVRSVTGREEEKLAKAVGVSDVLRAVYDSGIDKYHVTVDSSDSQGVQRYLVDARGGNSPTPTLDAEQLVTTQDCANEACASCALWAASRGLCYASCAAGQLYACAACLFVNSAALAFADCEVCFDRCL